MDKVAIVTGASRGIGECVARGLVQDGYHVALVARSKDALEKLKGQLSSTAKGAPQAKSYDLDVADNKAVQQMVADVKSNWGRIDLLFNNAGIGCLGTVDLPVEKFDKVIAINLRGAFNCLQAVVPIMKSQKSGTIINVSSRAGKIGFEGYGTYAASKFGLVGLSESLYRELAPLGIKVTALCPSWVDTDMAQGADIPVEEMICPDDILESVRWLVSLSPAAVVKELSIECRLQIE